MYEPARTANVLISIPKELNAVANEKVIVSFGWKKLIGVRPKPLGDVVITNALVVILIPALLYK